MDLLKELRKKNPTLRGVINSHLLEIKQAISEGYTKKEIYDLFKKSGSIKSDYVYFVRVLKQVLNGKSQKGKVKTDQVSSSGLPEKKRFVLQDLSKEEFE